MQVGQLLMLDAQLPSMQENGLSEDKHVLIWAAVYLVSCYEVV